MERAAADTIELRLPATRWIGGYFVAVSIGALGLGLAGLAIVAAQTMGWQGGMIVSVTSGFALAMATYTFRDAHAKHRLLIRASAEGVELRLPAARSLVRSLSAETRRLAWSEVAAIETRLEAYRSLGMANMQRAYVLRLHAGDSIFLGEDRALGTNLATDMLANLVARIRERFPVELVDLGMAEGRGGFLSVLFTAPPPWSAENLGAARQATLWNIAARPALVMLLVPLIVLLLSLLSR